MTNDNGKISVILCSSGKEAEIVEIEDSLEEMMNIVGGQIEEYMPFEDDVVIVCNADGKMNGLPINRTIRDESGATLDVVNGDFFICYGPFESEAFLSLPEDLANKYLEEYRWPEQVFLRNGVVSRSVKYNPGYREKEVAMLSGVREHEGNYEALDSSERFGTEELRNLFLYVYDKMTALYIEQEMPLEVDPIVYYMNGNDSTEFDWSVNDRLCEFGMFGKDDCYFIKTFVNKDRSVEMIHYKADEPNVIVSTISSELPQDINIENAANTLIEAERLFTVGDKINVKDWDLPLATTIDRVEEALELKAPLINRETMDNFNVKEEFLQEEKTEDR